jgi:hypothetical protein
VGPPRREIASGLDMVKASERKRIDLAATLDSELPDEYLIAQAVRAFADELGVAEKTVKITGGRNTKGQRVLDLHAAALVAVLRETDSATVDVNIDEVLDELLRHEQHFWYEKEIRF